MKKTIIVLAAAGLTLAGCGGKDKKEGGKQAATPVAQAPKAPAKKPTEIPPEFKDKFGKMMDCSLMRNALKGAAPAIDDEYTKSIIAELKANPDAVEKCQSEVAQLKANEVIRQPAGGAKPQG